MAVEDKRIDQFASEATVIQVDDWFHLNRSGTDMKVQAQQLIDLLPPGPTGPQGIQGPQGPQGPPGPQGGYATFGVLKATPYGAFHYPSPSGGFENPLIVKPFIVQIGSAISGLTWMKISTEKLPDMQDGAFWIRYTGEESSDPWVILYANETDANSDENRRAVAELLEDTPGLYTFVDVGDSSTVWGWIYTDAGIPTPDSPEIKPIIAEDASFIISEIFWQQSKAIEIPFRFILGSGSAPTLTFDLRVGAVGLSMASIGEFVFSMDSGLVQGIVNGKIILEPLEDGSARTWCDLSAGGREADILGPLILSGGGAMNFAFGDLFLSVVQIADDGAGNPLTFDLYTIMAASVI